MASIHMATATSNCQLLYVLKIKYFSSKNLSMEILLLFLQHGMASAGTVLAFTKFLQDILLLSTVWLLFHADSKHGTCRWFITVNILRKLVTD